MKLYIGGAWQGQEELARNENPKDEIWSDFHETILEATQHGEDPRQFARDFIRRHPNAVVIANEVGSGVVPMDKTERQFREAVGRALCVIAQASEQVTRVVCGIGVRIQ